MSCVERREHFGLMRCVRACIGRVRSVTSE